MTSVATLATASQIWVKVLVMKRFAFALVLLCACDKSQPTSQEPTSAEAGGLPPGNSGPEASVTAAECGAGGGTVVGDIGDGAIFKPDYSCESNGEAPTARIKAEEGGPLGVEGSICCGG